MIIIRNHSSLCRQNAELVVKASGTYSYQCSLKRYELVYTGRQVRGTETKRREVNFRKIIKETRNTF
jgi:hypothetical protein